MRIELAQALRRRRAVLLQEFFRAEDDLRAIGEDREAELEERAQEERVARVLAGLDDRSLEEVRGIHAALQRMVDGTYGTCVECDAVIAPARLRALPTAERCIDCAQDQEATAARPTPTAAEPLSHGHLPPDLEGLLDREVEETLRQLVRADRRIDLDELRIVCRHGVVRLDGAVPSEGEHQMLVKLVTDVAGCEDVTDSVRVNPILWERRDRSRAQPREHIRPSRFESIGTEDVVECTEEGIDWVPPDRPPSEEE
jgi:RNA polymerase-binding transcription factor DksA